jgi:hypothetical protein
MFHEWRFRIGIRWLWIEKHGKELLSRPKLAKSCSAKRRTRRRRRSLYKAPTGAYNQVLRNLR